MGRYISGGAGGSGSSSATPAINTSVITAEAVLAGDIITQGADGLAYWGQDPSAAGSSLRPIAQAVSTFNTLQSPVTSYAGVQGNSLTKRIATCLLSNGNYVVAWAETGAPYNVRFGIYNSVGVLQGAVQTVAASDSINPLVCLAALAAGGFAIAYLNGGTPKYCTYGNTGILVSGPNNVDAAPTNVSSLSIAPVSSGNFVIAYAITIGGIATPRFGVFSPAGTVIAAVSTLRSPTVNNTVADATFVIALSGGGFVCLYTSYDGTNLAQYFKRYNNAGAIQGAETAVRLTGNALAGVGVALTGGGFAVIQPTDAYVTVWSATGVLQGAAINQDAGAASLPTLAATTDGNFIAAWTSNPGSTIRYSKISAVGATLIAPTAITATGYSAGGTIAALSLSNGGFVLGWADATTQALTIAQFGGNNQQVGVTTILPTMLNFASGGSRVAVLQLASGRPGSLTFVGAAVSSSNSLAVGIINCAIQSQTPLGVAVASAAQGSAVPIQITGNITVRQGFLQPYEVDWNNYVVPGNKMSVIGNQAVMQGFQSNQRRQIN